MNRLRNLLFKMRRSEGDFQIQRYEEEEELFSVHIRRCLLVWISLIAIIELIREVFFYQLSGGYQPFMLFSFVIAYHFLSLKGGKWLWGGRIFCLIFPVILFFFSGYRDGFFSLAHEIEMTLADQGFSWFHIVDYQELGISADFVIVFFLLWGVCLFYELGKRWDWFFVFVPMLSSLWLFFMLDWNISWWFYPLMLAESFLILMPAVTAWGAISLFTLVLTCVLAFTLRTSATSQSGVWQAWQNWRYGVSQSALPEGNMKQASKMVRDKSLALVVETRGKDPYYLRGFIGNVYDSRSTWNNERKMIRSLEQGVWGSTIDVVDVLHTKGYYGNNKLTEHQKIKTLNSYYFQVRNVSANRKYLYLPYESKTGVDDFILNDIAVNGAAESLCATSMGGQERYQCKAVTGLAGNTANIMEEGTLQNGPQIQNNQRKMWKDYGQQSSADVYKEYIHRIDLALPKTTKTLIGDELSSYVSVKNVSPQGAYETIRRWMKSNIKYVETPSKIPKEKEFLEWFLKEEKAGNDVYMASCATMMFRYLGIPARYVEGYLYQPAKHHEVTSVLQSDAHAWVEIYVENLGWIPVEVTEKYEHFTASYLPNYQAISAETAKAEEDESEEEDEESDQEEQEEKEKSSEESSEEESTEIKKVEEQEKEDSKYNWNALFKFLLYVLKQMTKIIGSLIFLVVVVFTFWKVIKHYYLEIKWKRSVQAAVCITEWYRHLMMHLYLLENEKEKDFDVWDNRNEKVQQLLLKYDQSCGSNTLLENFEIYKKALFSADMITWNERKKYVHFCEREIKVLKKQMSIRQKMRLIFDDAFH